uniref:Neprilysin n=1 Tax=Hadrurus spadix TaxID=141984 RepID=A0A1W7RA39_9SCOR
MERKSYNTMTMGTSMDLLTKDENANFWERRTRTEQVLIIVCISLAILSFGLIIAVIVLSNKQNESNITTKIPVTETTQIPGTEECSTEICASKAKQLLASINDSINPCNDFYSYVCSGWQKANPIPETMESYSIFNILDEKITNDLKNVLPNSTFEPGDVRDKTKIFYKSCLDNDTRENRGVEGLKKILRDLGGWPLLGDKLNESYVWLDALAYAITELSTSPIITLGVEADAKNTTRYIIHLDQARLGIGRTELLYKNINDSRITEIITAYKNFIKASFRILDGKNDDLDKEVEDLVEFESSLAKISKSEVERRDPYSEYQKMNVSTLQSFLGEEIDIASFLSKVFSNISEVTNDTELIVSGFDYLRNLTELLRNKTVQTANYIGWMVVKFYGSVTTQEFQDAKFEFNKVRQGIKKPRPMDEICIMETNGLLGFALGSVYINDNFDTVIKAEIEDMVNQIKKAFAELLTSNHWMNDQSRELAKNKLDKMIPKIAFPSWINDTKALNEYYEKLGDIREDTFFENVITVAKFVIQKQLRKINEVHDRNDGWDVSPAIVNAFYDPKDNTINFPAGILQFPFYQAGLPPALNFASMGSVIGHEITHGFDDEGSQYDAEGNLENWWPSEVRNRFINESQCFVEQYENYTEPITGMKLKGKNTLGENIADNGGIREAFKAYKSATAETRRHVTLPNLDLTPDQLFFVNYAYVWCSNERKEFLQNMIQYNSHSPARYRVQGPCSNFEEFSKTFDCSADSTMNPEHKCLLW